MRRSALIVPPAGRLSLGHSAARPAPRDQLAVAPARGRGLGSRVGAGAAGTATGSARGPRRRRDRRRPRTAPRPRRSAPRSAWPCRAGPGPWPRGVDVLARELADLVVGAAPGPRRAAGRRTAPSCSNRNTSFGCCSSIQRPTTRSAVSWAPASGAPGCAPAAPGGRLLHELRDVVVEEAQRLLHDRADGLRPGARRRAAAGDQALDHEAVRHLDQRGCRACRGCRGTSRSSGRPLRSPAAGCLRRSASALPRCGACALADAPAATSRSSGPAARDPWPDARSIGRSRWPRV